MLFLKSLILLYISSLIASPLIKPLFTPGRGHEVNGYIERFPSAFSEF